MATESRNAGLYVGTRLEKKMKRKFYKLAVVKRKSASVILYRLIEELLKSFSEKDLDEIIRKRKEESDG